MAFDTKPNLSNAKFEQFAGETLTLSGRTEIHGIIEVENTGIFRLDDTNQQQGYVLTSNADGCGNWSAPSITGVSNGLTQSGQYVTWGGPLTGSSSISLETNSVGFIGCNGEGELGFGRYYQGETATQDLAFIKGSAKNEILLNNTNSGGTLTSRLHLFDQESFILQSKGAVLETSICYQEGITNALRITDSKNSKGMVYADDYSTSGITDPRWIPDYAAVTAATQSLTVGGVDTNIQYNDSNLLGGSNSFTWNDTTKILNVAGSISISGTSFLRAGDSTNSIEIGAAAQTTNTSNIAIGTLASATENYGVAMGSCVSSTAAGAIIMGYNTGGIIPNNVADSFDLTFNQTIPTLHIACQGVSYLVGESDAYPVMGFGTVAPTARVHIVATGATEGFRLQDGNEGADKVLTSDGNGNGTWSSVVASVTCTDFNTYTGDTDTRIGDIETELDLTLTGASNGLSVSGRTVVLGGTLTGNTYVDTTGGFSIAFNSFGSATGAYSASFGQSTHASGVYSFATGYATCAGGFFSNSQGKSTTATGCTAHAEGNGTCAFGAASHAEGNRTIAIGDNSHSQGICTTAFGSSSHSEGFCTCATGDSSHAEGKITIASGLISHSEGYYTVASGKYSHAGGYRSCAGEYASFAHGYRTSAQGRGSVATGCGRSTKEILAFGQASFNHSDTDSNQIAGHGALADRSAILGGCNHNIEVGNQRAAIIGGCSIKLTGTTYIDTTAVANLAVISTPSNNTTTDEVLVRNTSSGLVDYVSKASLLTEVNPDKVVDVVEQNSHGFAVQNVIGWAGGLYTKAIADGTYTGEIIGVVYEVIDTDNFKIAQAGWLTGFTGLVPNQTYWLSTSVAGNTQTSEPTVDGEVSRPVMVAQSSTEAIIFPYRGQIITSGDTPPPPNATVAGFDIIGDDSSTGFTVIHNFGTRDIVVNIWEAQTPWSKVIVDQRLTSVNSVDVNFDVAPATAEDYRVIITY